MIQRLLLTPTASLEERTRTQKHVGSEMLANVNMLMSIRDSTAC